MSCSLTATARASCPLPITETLAGLPETRLCEIKPSSMDRSSALFTIRQPTPPAPLRGLTMTGKRRSSGEVCVLMKGKPFFSSQCACQSLSEINAILFCRIVQNTYSSRLGLLQSGTKNNDFGMEPININRQHLFCPFARQQDRFL